MRHTYNRLGLNPLLFMPQISATSVSGATIIATIAVAGGMSVAAKNSLPGDMLYSMKISVNEDVLRSLTFSLASEAGIEASLAIERLREANALASQLRLDVDTQEDLARRFALHSKNMLTMSEQAAMSEKSETVVSSMATFRANLDKRESALVQTAEVHPAMRPIVSPLITQIRQTKGNVQQKMEIILARMQEANGDTFSIERDARLRIQEAANVIDDLNNMIYARTIMHPDIRTDIEKRIQEATSILVRAREELSRNAFATALALAHESFSLINQMHTLVMDTMTGATMPLE